MLGNDQTNRRALRLNPFVFPSDTDLRFVLLIVAVLGTSLLFYDELYFIAATNLERSAVDQICYQATRNVECIVPDIEALAEWIGLGVALLLSVTGAIYWAYPTGKIWFNKLRPISNANASPAMLMYLAQLCGEAGLSRSPIFLLDPYNLTDNGVTFGRVGRYYVSLGSGLLLRFETDRPAFRAIVLHELGHVRNADVDKTYLTISIGWAFAVAVLLPLILTLPPPWHFDQLLQTIFDPLLFNLFWRILILSVLIYLTRNAVLRAREVYADVRASVWDGPAGALRRILRTFPYSKGGYWRGLVSTHPDPEKRAQTIGDTSLLFRPNLWDVFATGVIFTSVLPNFAILTSYSDTINAAHPSKLGTALQQDGLGIIFAALVVGIVGLNVWRAIFANRILRESQIKVLRMSLTLTLGLLLGQVLSLTASQTGSGYFTDVGPRQLIPVSLLEQLGFLILLSMLLLAILFFFLRWIAVSATLWLEVATRSSSPRRTYWIGMAITSGILGTCFGQLHVLQKFAQALTGAPNFFPAVIGALELGFSASNTPSEVFLASQDPLVFFALISLWAYPLASWFWLRKAATTTQSNWMFLDASASAQFQPLPYQASFHLDWRLILGPACGVVFSTVALLLVYGLRLGIPMNDLVILAVLLQGIVAAIAASTIQSLRAFYALLVTFVTGCIMSIGIILAYLLSGQQNVGLYLEGAQSIFMQVVNEGALVAIPVVLVVSALTRWMSRSNKQDSIERAVV